MDNFKISHKIALVFSAVLTVVIGVAVVVMTQLWAIQDATKWNDHTHQVLALGISPSVEDGLSYYVPECRLLIETAFGRCATSGEPFDLTAQIVTRLGRKIWVRTAGEAVRDASGAVVEVRGAFQDIDDLIRAQEALRLSETRLASSLDQVDEGFLILSRDYRVVFVNKAGLELLGVSKDLIGRYLWDAFPETNGTLFQDGFARAYTSGETVHFETYYAPRGVHLEVGAYPLPDGLVSRFQDVTSRLKAQAELRESEERFRLVSAVTNDLIWDWDVAADKVWFSDRLREYGYDPSEVRTSQFWIENIAPADSQRVKDQFFKLMEEGATEWMDEYEFIRADGSVARVIDRAMIIRDAHGRAQRMLGSMMDITERTAVERQLREAQKLEAVGQLTGGVAHDFNNLLTVIIGTAESLSERVSDDAESLMLAEMTSAAAERGAELTNRLLAFARRQPLEPRPTDIGRLLMGLDVMLRRTLSEQINLEVIRGGGLWSALVDPGQLETAILNLAINARDAMPSGGRLTIETSNVSLDQDYAAQHDEVSPGQYVMVSVSDTGTGMDRTVVERAFDPFFTTKDVGQGSGLGLSMVYGFAKQSRGHAKIYSEVGEGTTVRLYLPRSIAGLTPHIEPASEDAPRGSERILVVEDDALVRDHVARLLRALGYEVALAVHAADAMTVLTEERPFDLLFTDVVMPGDMNGRQLSDAAKRVQPSLKVLFTSGYTENAIVHHGRLDPGVALLSKPYRRGDLAKRVRQVLDGG